MGENFPKLVRDNDSQIQEAQWIPGKVIQRKQDLGILLGILWLDSWQPKTKRKIFKVSREKWH